MVNKDFSRLTRTRHEMPDDVAEALQKNNLLTTYHYRPPYQQNDYVGWITRAKRQQTRIKKWPALYENAVQAKKIAFR